MESKPSDNPIDDAVSHYSKTRTLCQAFTRKTHELLKELLNTRSIKFHTIEERTKTVESFRDKLRRQDLKYNDPVKEMPDLCGTRIILYYDADVKAASELIDEEFSVDPDQSGDKRSTLNHDQFGYLSVHKVVRIPEQRARLLEWKQFESFQAEIQIRTVLQHAWATISHQLEYKHEAEIPEEYRRKLVRLAGLLELADEQFEEIRTARRSVQEDARRKIGANDLRVPLNLESLREFVQNSELVASIEEAAKNSGFELIDEDDPTIPRPPLSALLPYCIDCEIDSVQSLRDAIDVGLTQTNKYFTQIITMIRERHISEFIVAPVNLLELILFAVRPDRFPKDRLSGVYNWPPNLLDIIHQATADTFSDV